ncbi:MAG: hypothetical protein GOV00_01240 [Candidatus Altiarchaeota archaeon]|nr:hypothetical protein [Candidatus Altiarchaeota archaeon]
MEKVILIAGGAGQGIAKSAEVLAKSFTRRGYFVFNYRDYPSLIRGGLNFNILKIGIDPVASHEWKADYAVFLSQQAFDEHKSKSKLSITDSKIKGGDLKVDLDTIVQKAGAPKIAANAAMLGALYKAMQHDTQPLMDAMADYGKHADINRKVAWEGFQAYDGKISKFSELQGKDANYFVSGSWAISMGAIASGLDLYIAYPMTPATPVLHILAELENDFNYKTVQLENELAVANGALGASFGGSTVMIGTSGGGLALMGEAMSLQGMSELPLVAYLSMRAGPATGVPTYTGQGDINFALNIGHGEFSRAAIVPGDAREAYERTVEAFYLTNKFGVLSLLIGDKHISESNYTHASLPVPRVTPERFLVGATANHKNYAITSDGVSPRAVPGKKGVLRATSYEHDEAGMTVEDEPSIIKMVEKRIRKARTLEKAVSKLEPVTVYGEGKHAIVSWGSTKGAIIDALKHLKDVKFVQISYLRPFPAKEVEAALKGVKSVTAIEVSVTCAIANMLREFTGTVVDHKITKYDTRPFTSHEIVSKMRRVIK